MEEIFPSKILKITSQDKPWVRQEVKLLDRRCKREFYEDHKSDKWQELYKKFKDKCWSAKESYYKNMVEDLKQTNMSQWYSKVKRMGGADNRQENGEIDELHGLDIEEQADVIAKHYAEVSNEYDHHKTEDIPKNVYDIKNPPPRIEAFKIHKRIQKMSKKKATVYGDIPMKIIKDFSVELAEYFQKSKNLLTQDNMSNL